MKPGHSHNTPRTKRLKTEAVRRQQTPAEIQNSRKAAAAQHLFDWFRPEHFGFFRSCPSVNREWQAKKEIYFRTRMVELMGRTLTDAEYKESNYETRFKRIYPQLKQIHTLSQLNPWNILLTCQLSPHLYTRLLGSNDKLLGRLWFLRETPTVNTDRPPVTPYFYALFNGLPKLADKILNGPQFTDPQNLLQETKDDLLVYPSELLYGLDAKKEYTPEQIRLWNKNTYNHIVAGNVHSYDILMHPPSQMLLGANFDQLRELVVFNTASFCFKILFNIKVGGYGYSLHLGATINCGQNFLYALGTNSRQIQGVKAKYFCQNKDSNATHTIHANDPRTLAVLKCALDTKLLNYSKLEGLFRCTLDHLATNQPICFEIICSLLNNGMAFNTAAALIERTRVPQNDPTSHLYLFLKDLLAAFTSKNFSQVIKHFSKPELRGSIVDLANWNFQITTPGAGPFDTPQITIMTLEAYAQTMQCAAEFSTACSALSPSSSNMDCSSDAASASSSSSQLVYRG